MDTVRQNGFFGAAAVAVVAALVLGEGLAVAAWLVAGLLISAGAIQRNARTGTLLTALLCFASNAYLFSQKLDAESGPSLCNINQVLNCDIVNSSQASEMFGLPITLYGMGFYMGLIIASMFAQKSTPRLFQVSGLFACLNLVYSAWLAYESKRIGAVCVMCISIYIGNGLLLWAAIRGLREQGESLLRDLGKTPLSTSALTITMVFCLIVTVGAGQWNEVASTSSEFTGAPKKPADQGSAVDPTDPQFLRNLYHAPRGTVGLDGTEPTLGDANAPYTIVEFADFGCPHCARASKELKALVRDVPSVQVKFRVFPLSGGCNPSMEGDRSPERCLAASAAECAHAQDMFWEYTSLLFANQGHFTPDDLSFMANQSGLDIAAFDACMNDPATLTAVRADAVAGSDAEIFGTPTMFLKGTHGDAWIEVPNGAMAIYALVHAHAQGTELLPPSPAPSPEMR